MTAPGIALETVHSFNGSDGANPVAALLQGHDSNLYGTASSGGASNFGTVFRLDAQGTLAMLTRLQRRK